MGRWWQEAHLRVSFQARPSLARKARLRSAVFWTSAGTGSAADSRRDSAKRIAAAVRGRMTKLLLLGGFSRRGEGWEEGFCFLQFTPRDGGGQPSSAGSSISACGGETSLVIMTA